MSTIRNRQKHRQQKIQISKLNRYTTERKIVADDSKVQEWNINSVLLSLAGIVLCCKVAWYHAWLTKQIHENHQWFSNIKDIEREISFRTEAGLYYSYYKQMILAPTISDGLKSIVYDNKTEHLRTINILQRFNIYQEVILSVIYRLTSIKGLMQPIFFYINSVFFLHGCLVAALYVLAWMLSKSWLAGVLAACLYIFNRLDTTRVSYTIPLRESFSLPFLWIQILCVTWYLKKSCKFQRLCMAFIAFSMTCFVITWQFAQFVLLLQAFALFGCGVLDIVPLKKVQSVFMVQMISILLVAVLQFGNMMMLSSIALSFIPAAFIIFYIKGDVSSGHLVIRLFKLIFYIILVFIVTAVFNTIVKIVLSHEADTHIFKFVLFKFGLGYARDFDINMYICNGAFGFLPYDTFSRLTDSVVLPFYAITHLVLILLMVYYVLNSWRKNELKDPTMQLGIFYSQPELAYTVIQVVFFGAMAITTLRFKYLWTPYMCVLGAVGISKFEFWRKSLPRKFEDWQVDIVRHGVTLIVLAAVLIKCLPALHKDLDDLREFYDPETVELMDWIKKSTPPAAAFTGSMQLLAGVKLCTGRPIANHPHYEDKVLRERTLELYQMYARTPPEEMHKLFLKYDISYFILEDSICLARSDGCRLPDLIDINNGQIPDHGKASSGLVLSSTPRFCYEIRNGKPAFNKFFRLVFHNKTFRIFQVIRI